MCIRDRHALAIALAKLTKKEYKKKIGNAEFIIIIACLFYFILFIFFNTHCNTELRKQGTNVLLTVKILFL